MGRLVSSCSRGRIRLRLPITELEHDAICELANIAMAKAAASIRRMVGHQVLMSVPACEFLPPAAAAAKLLKGPEAVLVAVRQDFTGSFSGRALLIFPEPSSLELMRAVLGRDMRISDILDLEDEALAETGNIILNAWLATIANILKQSLRMSLPAVIRRNQQHIFEQVTAAPSFVLFLHVKFEVQKRAIHGFVALLMACRLSPTFAS
jgi:chemotaxis protein CheC